MFTIPNGGKFSVPELGRFVAEEISVTNGGMMTIDGAVHTTTTKSDGIIDGHGELLAWWASSEFIGGVIRDQYHDPAGTLTTVYYGERPVEASWVQVVMGSVLVLEPGSQWSIQD